MCLFENAMEKILDRSAHIGVVGLGYVGLPFIVEKAKMGFSVLGIDQNENRVAKVAAGENYIKDVVDQDLKEMVQLGLIKTTSSFEGIAELDIIVICVPTPLDGNLTPDLSYVCNVTEHIAKKIRPGQLISLESTTYPGTTEEIIKPILEKSGLKAGIDFFLVHSPERVDPGNKRYTTKNTNKVVGGHDKKSLELGMAFYGQTIDHVVSVSSATAAEMVKVFENTFRAVNIALVNELLMLCDRMDLSVWEILDAAFTKPFGIMPFYPGPGVGGHCIPLDPHYLEWKAREFNFSTHFIALAGEINRNMPAFVVEKVSKILNSKSKSIRGSKILILGMAYKANLDDCRESPAVEIFEKLKNLGALMLYHDSLVLSVQIDGIIEESIKYCGDIIGEQDLIIITTAHSHIDYSDVVDKASCILDTRYATKGIVNNKVILL